MNHPISNNQTDEDGFILERDQQQQQQAQMPGTLLPNCNIIIPQQINITYEIIKSQDYHVVLVHEETPTDTTNTESETGLMRRFTQDNPVIPDEIFMSPVR